ncbi:MAG: molybdenum cofactor guanylyltransferase MobA [Gallionellaceae bacterium]|nr:molybdenum cofactor guanylyltransferase MobA [Gallionellaceae bacterium]
MKQPAITTVVLAGGLGTRIGGDKGLQLLHGKALIDWVLEVISPQSDEVLVNANTNYDLYAARGYRIIADQLPNHAGPLAGLQAALLHAHHDWVASVPCDTPFLPHDLLARLAAAAQGNAAVAAVAGQRQPAIALYHKRVLPKLNHYLNTGERKVYGWLDSLQVNEAVFSDAAAFTNINSSQELLLAQQIVG